MPPTRKRYKLKFTALSPIHIGTGEEIDPLEYLLGDEPIIRVLNLSALLVDLPENHRKKFNDLVCSNANDLIELRKFFRQLPSISIEKHTRYTIDITRAFREKYDKEFNSTKNSLLVQLFLHSGDSGVPVIPGSSVKGAIRTALISKKMRELYSATGKIPKTDKNRNSWEAALFGGSNPKDDPFRMLGISDINLPKGSTIIDTVKTISVRPEKDKKISYQLFYEMTYGQITDDKEFAYGEGELRIDNRLKEKNQNIQQEWTIPAIVEACKDFYLSLIKKEFRKFYQQRQPSTLYANAKKLLETTFGENEFPIRLGRFSHCEAVTVDPGIDEVSVREPKTRRGKDGTPLPYGTTRAIANDLPMGWAKIKLEEVE